MKCNACGCTLTYESYTVLHNKRILFHVCGIECLRALVKEKSK